MTTYKQQIANRNHYWMMNIALATLITLWVAMIGLSVTIWFPWNPVPKLDLTVIDSKYNPYIGGMLQVNIDYCKTRNWIADRANWSLVNNVTILLPLTASNLPIGCHEISIFLPIAQHIAPATYKLNLELEYRPWPWTTVTYIKESQPFSLKAAQ